MPETMDKSVWLEDMKRVADVVKLLERTYTTDVWTGGVLFQDTVAGFLLVACFDPALYPGKEIVWETLFPARDLRDVTLEQACSRQTRFRPWLAGDISQVLAHMRLLPTQEAAVPDSKEAE